MVPSDHPFVGRRAVGFAEVLEQPLVGVLESGALSSLLEEAAERLGRHPRYRFLVASTEAARQLVAAGLGITIMPDGVARPYEAMLGLRGIPLSERWARRRLRLVGRAGEMPPAVHLLRDHLRKRSHAWAASVRRSAHANHANQRFSTASQRR